MENWVWIIVGIVVPFVVLFILGFVCWCLCKCFQKGQESESIELQDIEGGNDQRSHIRQSGLSQNEPQEERGPPTLILTPLQNESKNIIVEPKNLNKLHLNVIEKNYMQTPIELFSKHVVYGKITKEKAIQLSNSLNYDVIKLN